MEPPGSSRGSHVSASPQGPTVSKALTIHTAKLKPELLYSIAVLKDNSNIQTLERGCRGWGHRIREGATSSGPAVSLRA